MSLVENPDFRTRRNDADGFTLVDSPTPTLGRDAALERILPALKDRYDVWSRG